MPPPLDRYRALILDFVDGLTDGLDETLQGGGVEQGLHRGAWRATLNWHPEGRRLYLNLEAVRINNRRGTGPPPRSSG